ncbi:efflux RND transporter periplasmic adaptor subunit [Bradyrhizobium sp.]|uniref:efflux RND transporter periplasmic adaptor subunit n=1 Tax=Bradyrhizobium sp. TaxID=376 RepID=UPI001E0DCBB9|nr:efflux RND transporter periplasmic adaptor subunit [Bradyrhizobium sp.]MBI5318294.1 efflux RND transporter periplasmic adaptor subunit [Bradyrhizobium sp.]
MSRAALMAAAAVIVAAAAGSGWFLMHRGQPQLAMTTPAAAADTAPAPLYYRDPDGKPLYSLTPKQTPDGRDYTAVPAGGDISFDLDSTPEPAASAQGPRKIRYYRNPMGLPDTSPVPKKDSMGMDYIPVYEGEDSDDGSVKLSPGKIQRTGVKSEAASARVIRTVIRAPGTIQLDERRISVISMRTESFIQRVANVTTGSAVKKGQPLMETYSPAISSAAAEYIATIGSPATARVEQYGRGSRQRLKNFDVPDTVIAAMEKTQTVPLTIEWTAPRDGIVLERNAIDGMRAQPGDVLFRVADTSVVWAVADVAERDLGQLSIGQPVAVKARGFPGREFAGSIAVIYPQINRDTRTARVRVELANADLVLLPDMYVDAEINVGKPEPVLAVPESAVLDTGTRQTVLVDKGSGRFEPREVKVGQRGDGYVEVRDGLADGEPVVVAANFLIDAESNLKAALKGLATGGQP